MRFLIDNALSPAVAELLRAQGHEAVHVREYAMQEASDADILDRAELEKRVVVSADSDFGAILAAREAESPSFILFRDPNLLLAKDYAELLLSALPLLDAELRGGCVATFRSGRLRVRKLPFNS